MAAPQYDLTNKYEGNIFQDENYSSTESIINDWFKDLIHWWYISMPVWFVLSLRRVVTVIDDQLSISLLIANFFIPWHRDGTFVGYFIGLVMKLIFIPIGLVVLITTIVIYITFLIIWCILPLVTIFGIVATPFLSSILQ